MAEVRFLTDEDIKSAIFDGVLLRLPDLDIVRVQDVGLRTAADPVVLRFAAEHNRILVTHDVSTMHRYAIDRILKGEPMPGLIEIGQSYPIGQAIDELVLIRECSSASDWEDKIMRLPLI